MKKILTYALSLCLILCIFTSCGSSDSSDSGSSQGEGESAMHTYKTQEIWVKNGGHEFFDQPFEDAMSHILTYLEKQTAKS